MSLDDFAQVEALIGLYGLFDVRAPVPASRGYAASPDLCLELVRQVYTRRPALVVECGPGLSSLWLGYALQKTGAGRLVSVEHQAPFRERTADLVRLHGLDDVVEIRLAPLEPVNGQPWYAPAAFADLDRIDLLLVDGPPGTTGPLARLPAVPVLRDRLAPGALIVVDDYERADEQAAVERWLAELDGARLTVLEHEKRTALIQL